MFYEQPKFFNLMFTEIKIIIFILSQTAMYKLYI